MGMELKLGLNMSLGTKLWLKMGLELKLGLNMCLGLKLGLRIAWG